ncbi:MAG: serine protease, partial [Clostridia bacterium]|nr:serine protease [Clostridia bacterium]
VTVSYAALSVNIKNTHQPLAEKLIEKGSFTAETYGANYTGTKLTDKENEGKTSLIAEQIYTDCSPAVFYIETFDESGAQYWSGSGFFIDESGIAVTTFFTLEGASRAEITIPGSGAKYKVSGIYDMSAEYDWAVFQVDGSGFTALDINAMPVKGAANVYTISSPEGLQNTVAQGIVSNSRRVLYDKYNYIQTTAPISEGSDGGALVNDYGEVVGIVYESYYDGQNLNFAIPISTIAIADTTTLTPFEECNWNHVWYSYDETEVTVKEGEAAVYSFDYDYSLANYDNTLDLKVTSSDYSVVNAMFGLEYGTVRILGNKAGTATVVISDNLSDDTHTITVTVEENPEYVSPKVAYTSDLSELKLEVGAAKQLVVTLGEFGITDTPDGSLAASYTVKSSNSNISVEYEMAEDGMPYVFVTVKGNKKTSGEITVSNDKTNDTLVIPVTVGDRYKSAYQELTSYLIQNGELKVDEEDPLGTYYMYAVGSETGGIAISYYPKGDNVVMSLIGTQETTSMLVAIIFEKSGDVSYVITMPNLNVIGVGPLTPKSFGKSAKAMTFSSYEGIPTVKSELEKLAPTVLAAMIYSFDKGVLPTIIPGMDMTDFGFVNMNYELFGLSVTE